MPINNSMDTKQLIQDARARFDHLKSKHQLSEKYKSQLTVTYQGGMWEITPQLLSYLKTSPDQTILVDVFQNPIKVDSKQFYEFAQSKYDSIMNSWYSEHQQLQRNR